MNYVKTLSLTLTIIGLSYLFFIYQPNAARSLRPEPNKFMVETAPVREKIVTNHFETLGNLASMDSIDISSELAGQIASIYFQPGAYVKKGTRLIQLDDTILKSELSSAKANLILSQTNYKRLSELAQKKLASAQTLDEAQATLQKRQNTVKAKDAQLAKLRLCAPFSGVLGSKQISIGQYVKVGQPLVRLIAKQKLRVEYNIPERYLSQIQLNQLVKVTSDSFPNRDYQGRVNYIAPAIDQETRTVAVEALINNGANLLHPGAFVHINHLFGEKRRHFLVPEESLIPTINGEKVFVLRNNKAIAVPVKTGLHRAAMTEIESGLKSDDIVIVRGQHKLKEGSQVIASQTRMTE